MSRADRLVNGPAPCLSPLALSLTTASMEGLYLIYVRRSGKCKGSWRRLNHDSTVYVPWTRWHAQRFPFLPNASPGDRFRIHLVVTDACRTMVFPIPRTPHIVGHPPVTRNEERIEHVAVAETHTCTRVSVKTECDTQRRCHGIDSKRCSQDGSVRRRHADFVGARVHGPLHDLPREQPGGCGKSQLAQMKPCSGGRCRLFRRQLQHGDVEELQRRE